MQKPFGKITTKPWQIAAAVAIFVLPTVIGGADGALLTMLTGLVVMSLLQRAWGHGVIAGPVAFAVAVLFLGLGSVGVMMSVSGFLMAILLLPQLSRTWRQRAVYRGLAGAFFWSFMVIQLQLFAGMPAPALLAQTFTDWLGQNDLATRNRILVSMYQMGLARLPEGTALPQFSLGSLMLIPEDLAQQLIFSFRSLLEDMITLSLPAVIVEFGLLCGILSVLLPEKLIRSVHSGTDKLPAFRCWFFSRGGATGIFLIYILSMFLNGDGWTGTFGTMCRTLADMALMIQGASMVAALAHRKGKKAFIPWLIDGLLVLFSPMLLTLAGMIDQVFDIRQMRHQTESEE